MGLLASGAISIVEFNRAFSAGIATPTTKMELDEASAWLEDNAAPGWSMQIAPAAQTEEVEDWLRQRAMAASGNGWAKFARGASPVGGGTQTSKLHVRPVDARNAEAFGQIAQAGFGLPEGTVKWFAALSGRPGWHLYLAYEGETPIASGAAFTKHGMAWLGVDATLADYRRRGAQTALINRRIEGGRAARLAGFIAETGQPSNGQETTHTSYSNYRRAGFVRAYVRPNYKPG
jgi:hypothetical protein